MVSWITKKISDLKSSSLAKKILKKMPTFSFQEKELNPWTSCCDGPVLKSDLFSKTNLGVCPKCNRHHIINAKQRLDIFFSGESNYRILNIPIDENLDDPLRFESMGIKYIDKLKATRKRSGDCAIKFAVGKLSNGVEIVAGAMSFDHFGGSVGVHEGNAIIHGVTYAMQNKNPLIIFPSGGGQRLQESLFSLFQMTKTTQIISEFKKLDPSLPYILCYTGPVLGGISASFASPSLADVTFAEKDSIVGFAGRRVVEATSRTTLSSEFQKPESLKKNGQCDEILNRKDINETVTNLLSILLKKNELKTADAESNEDREVTKKITTTA